MGADGVQGAIAWFTKITVVVLSSFVFDCFFRTDAILHRRFLVIARGG